MRAGRRRPNVLVTGTPGTGKSATVEGALEQLPGMRGLNVGAEVRAHGLWEGEEEDGAVTLDEERLLDHLEEVLAPGGFLVEHHGCELFPERWFDAVVVLTADNTLLWDRLAARGYSQAKIANNVECEIMQVGGLLCARRTLVRCDRTPRSFSLLHSLVLISLQVVVQEARDSYAPAVVHVWPSDTAEQLLANSRALARLVAALEQGAPAQ